MSSGLGAGMGADMLQQILQQKFQEQAAMRELANRERETAQRGAASQRDFQLRERGLDQDAQRFEAMAGQAQAKQAQEAAAQQQMITQAQLRAAIQGSQNMAGTDDPTGSLGTRNALRVALTAGGAKGNEIPQEPEVEKPAAVRPVNVSPGQRLVDPATGKVLYAAPDRPQAPDRPGAPQVFYDEDGRPHAIQFGASGAVEVPLPPGLTGRTAPKAAPKTPAEIEAEAIARARGTATGKQEAGGGGLFDAVAGIFGGGGKDPNATAGPKVGERRVVNGKTYEWDGTGWLAK